MSVCVWLGTNCCTCRHFVRLLGLYLLWFNLLWFASVVSIFGFSFKGRWRAIKSMFNGRQGIAAVRKIFPTWFKEAAAQSFWSRHDVALVLKQTIKLMDRKKFVVYGGISCRCFFFFFFFFFLVWIHRSRSGNLRTPFLTYSYCKLRWLKGLCLHLYKRLFWWVYFLRLQLPSDRCPIYQMQYLHCRSRRIPLNVRAISAKINYLKTAHGTVKCWTLFETSHFNSLLQVTPRLNSKAKKKEWKQGQTS